MAASSCPPATQRKLSGTLCAPQGEGREGQRARPVCGVMPVMALPACEVMSARDPHVDALQAIGWLGFTSGCLLFLVPLHVLHKISAAGYKLDDFSIMPFLTALPMAGIWTIYNGWELPCALAPFVLNAVGTGLELFYVLFFMWHAGLLSTARGRQYTMGLVGVLVLIVIVALAAIFDQSRPSTTLGVAAVVFTVIMFVSPLGVVPAVLRTRSVEFMPWPITATHGFNASIWLTYGILRGDVYYIVPNGIGVLLFILQVVVYIPVASGLLGPPTMQMTLATADAGADATTSSLRRKDIPRVATEQTSLKSIRFVDPSSELDDSQRPIRRTQSARPFTRAEREGMLTNTERIIFAATPW